MTLPIGAAGLPSRPALSPAAERLRETARQLESVFVHQMFKAMRETVSDNPLVAQGPGEEIFTDMLDQRLAEQAPAEWSGSHSLSEALYRQLARRAGVDGGQP